MPKTLLPATESVTHHEWLMRPHTHDAVTHLMTQQNISHEVAQFMTMRAIDDDYQLWLTPSLKEHTPDPAIIADMSKAATRIAHAIKTNETIGIISDYDVDGVTAAAQLVRFLRHYDAPHAVRIPHRREGYGPNANLLNELTNEGISLLVSLDSGTASGALWQTVSHDVIVVDHHLCAESLTIHGFINPQRDDDTSGLTMMCASGLTFLLLIELRRTLRRDGMNDYDLMPLLDYACLGTLCDMVPLTAFNRVLTRVGLRQLQNKGASHHGLRALMKVAAIKHDKISTSDMTFGLGPRLNAAGRMEHADSALHLLTTDHEGEAFILAQKLDELNKERRQQEQSHSKLIISRLADEPHQPFILARGDFHAGVVGLIASRLANHWQTLALVLYEKEDGHLAGSVRSGNGVHIGDVLAAARQNNCIVQGGGHAAAGGLTLAAHQWNDFEAFLTTTLANHQPPTPQWLIDFDCPLADIQSVMSALTAFAPWGMNHPPPLVLCRDLSVHDVRFIKDGHLRCRLCDNHGNQWNSIAFRAYKTPLGDVLHKDEGLARPLLLRLNDGMDSIHIVDTAKSNTALNT